MGLLLVSCGIGAFAQSGGSKGLVSGTVVDNDDNSPVMQATVQILAVKDSSMVTGDVTNNDGRFALSVRPGKYLLKVSFVGYTPTFQSVTLTKAKPRVSLGTIKLHSDAIMLEGAVVVAQAPEVTASEDTLVYNSSAYRVPEGSALEELVKKLPGPEIDVDGKITINGKEINKIMIVMTGWNPAHKVFRHRKTILIPYKHRTIGISSIGFCSFSGSVFIISNSCIFDAN